MLDRQYVSAIEERINQKTKPLGALGQLEEVASQLALIQSQDKSDAVTKVEVTNPTMLIFAGDHGIADAGVSIAPSAVTQQMVLNFLNGGAAINCFCSVNNIELKVVDAGILLPVESSADNFVCQRLGNRTNNFAEQAAMTESTVQEGIELGKKLAIDCIENDSNLLMFGEMGIGNTSSAAAILSALSGEPAKNCVGYGTGITAEQYEKKLQLVSNGVARCTDLTPTQVLAEVGGFEIVQIVGAILASAERKTAMLIDGFIVSSAAYVATMINPACREYMIFAHKSDESGHRLLLEKMNATPLLDLGLRLGEGTGAALALPLIKASAEFYNSMASFASAGVTV
ncbi:nicotinate-nucleotide--dimethylbenzimidazole phosphoribosyltransferase [Vibrio sp. 99-8-1]|uniref:nicotinate-nucleotide--dimethylbenzimidazole phosphoribosyltransferase n=1 Tax=Vibrio sp. 99-8-1 TaxID=2607602 RepID=UPI0014935C7C|nr:nicotinate-nucleotide--dimethylbenzimidazole phosphoribosyltransferase [Vibrio sp. 99-8-1]NOI68536.1 nicotinate-nucleotide--dimethylbenzimidazole phosphoribosyltransferase [Vibrio sp. 99-8-1]